ncbi:hypothetical protein [Streptomyces sp. NPDC056480]|uniref:hypothetical protein n=1 Tax=Streptomyces sp. NPDC056480 TaxID=3345833 RepID=UPI00369C30CC
MADGAEVPDPGVPEHAIEQTAVVSVAPEHRLVPGHVDREEIQLALGDLSLGSLHVLGVPVTRLGYLRAGGDEVRHQRLAFLRLRRRAGETDAVLDVRLEGVGGLAGVCLARGEGVRLRVLQEALHEHPGVTPGAGDVPDLLRRATEAVTAAAGGVLLVPGGLPHHLGELLAQPEVVLGAVGTGVAHSRREVGLSPKEGRDLPALLGHELAGVAHQPFARLAKDVRAEAHLVERRGGCRDIHLGKGSPGFVVPCHPVLARQFVADGDGRVTRSPHRVEKPHGPADHSLRNEPDVRSKTGHRRTPLQT